MIGPSEFPASPSAPSSVAPLGTTGFTQRGFPKVTWTDDHDSECILACSSVIGDYDDALLCPGTSAIWLGVEDVRPMVLAKDAAKVGIQTKETVGWVPYSLPPEVLLSTHMHLRREEVASLILRLQQWLDTGKFTPPSAEPSF